MLAGVVLFVIATQPIIEAFQLNLAWLELSRAASGRVSSFNRSITMFQKETGRPGVAADAFYGLGTAYLLAEQLPEAVDAFRKGTQADSVSTRNQVGLARAYMALQDLASAARELLLAGVPVNSVLAAGDNQMKMGKWAKAIHWYETARIMGGALPALNELTLGVAYVRIGQIGLAQDSFRSVLESGSADAKILAEAHYQLGILLFWSKPQEAEQHFNAATQLDPQNVNAHLASGDLAYLYRHDLAEMEEAYMRAMEISPSHVAGWLSTAIRQTARADDPRWVWLGRALEANGQPCRALEAYDQAPDGTLDTNHSWALKEQCP
jgi:tetratricopeptide (TPR) repeat protein